MKKQLLRLPRWRLILAALLLLLIVALGWKTVRLVESALRAQRNASALMAAARELQRDPTNQAALAALAPAIEKTRGSLEVLQGELRPLQPLLVATRPLPSQVSWLADVPDALSVAVDFSQVGASLAGPLSEVALNAKSEPGKNHLQDFIAQVAAVSDRLPDLTRTLDSAEAPLQRVQGRTLGGPLRSMGPIFDRAAQMLPAARSGLQMLAAFGPAVGMEGPKSYLILGQNNAEIRATGGFIGSMGIVTLDHGKVTQLEYGSSYDPDLGVSVPLPPAPLIKYMDLGGWYLRDANWWPDFPASAAQVEEAWRRAGKGPIDGVIALDTTAIEALLKSVGPVDVPGYGPVSADNFEQRAAEELYSKSALASASSFREAKDSFLGAAGHAIIARLFALPPADVVPVAQQLASLLDKKHLLLAFKDQRLIQPIHANGWDGAILDTPGDYLYVVDTTVSYGDTYRLIKSSATLKIQVGEDGSQRHELVLDYNNVFPNGLPSWMPPTMLGGAEFDPSTGAMVNTPGFWGNWLRIYLPSDAQVSSVDGLSDAEPARKEFGRVVVAGYLPVGPGEHRSVTISYVTTGGKGPVGEDYRLFVQKQPGLDSRPLNVEVTWPNGTRARYEGSPDRDQWIDVKAGDTSNGNETSK